MKVESVEALITKEGRKLLFGCKKEDAHTFLFSPTAQKLSEEMRQGVAEQLLYREKLAKKLPYFSVNGALVEGVLLEQATVEAVSLFRATLLRGESCLEMTGGMGADTVSLSKNFEQYTFCEIDKSRARLFEYNKHLLDMEKVEVFCEDSIAFLENTGKKYDWIFIDPARRSGGKKGSIALSHCLPNVLAHLALIKTHCDALALKLSPAYDISQLLREIPWIYKIFVISYKGEVREILALGDTGTSADKTAEAVEVVAVALSDSRAPFIISSCSTISTVFSSTAPGSDASAVVTASGQYAYLYEPDPSIIKADLVRRCGESFGLTPISLKSVFLGGDKIDTPFPGRVFRSVKKMPWSRKIVAKYLSSEGITHASVMRRDFPLSPEELRKRFKLKESSTTALLFTKDEKGDPFFYHLERV